MLASRARLTKTARTARQEQEFMQRAPRKLTVLASLDVAGYTRLVERDERETLLALARVRRNVLRPSVYRHSGNLFKTMGDGALVEFQSVEDGVEWAIAFQTQMAEFNQSRPDHPIRVRVGVGLADVFVRGDDRFGAAIGFVVRLQEASPPGGIAITHSVRWQLTKALAAQFGETQWIGMKGKDEQYEVWVWTGPASDPEAPLPSSAVGYRAHAEAPAPAPIPVAPLPALTRIEPSQEGQASIVVMPRPQMNGGRSTTSSVFPAIRIVSTFAFRTSLPAPYNTMYSPDDVGRFRRAATPQDDAAVHPLIALAHQATGLGSFLIDGSGPVAGL
ncbi:MAG: hypothetical protein J0H08_15720, partial [Rhizobiales bacterium]|nr:hypothetical protein [Hyphomicrobiales bacterium]